MCLMLVCIRYSPQHRGPGVKWVKQTLIAHASLHRRFGHVHEQYVLLRGSGRRRQGGDNAGQKMKPT
jgi:hypothetical protein